jgi:hypothetical protein
MEDWASWSSAGWSVRGAFGEKILRKSSSSAGGPHTQRRECEAWDKFLVAAAPSPQTDRLAELEGTESAGGVTSMSSSVAERARAREREEREGKSEKVRGRALLRKNGRPEPAGATGRSPART